MPRSRTLFDDDWSFYLGDIHIPESVKAGMGSGLTDIPKKDEGGKQQAIAFSDKVSKASIDPATWRKLSLPHDFVIEGAFKNSPVDADKTHGFLPRGVGYYRKTFSVPESDKGLRLALEFDGIFRNSRIWLNGQIVMDHRSGYTSFQVDITDNLRYGAEGENCILVRADATDAEGWWYEGGGIYRHVWLRKTAPVHVAHWGTYVTTPDAKAARVEVTVHNESLSPADVSVRNVVLDPSGREVARAEGQLSVASDAKAVLAQELPLPSPSLWSPETPSLYKLVTELRQAGEPVDSYETSFGVRTFEFNDKGFFLNGKHTIIKGTCNHQDFAGIGVALPDSINEYKIRLLKEMGSNGYRCAHHPPTPELLDACDRLGMLVMDENRQLDSSDKGMADLESMIYRDRNHPCIVMWSMENEEPLQGTERGARIVESLVKRTHRLDPTRPTVSAMNHGWYTGGYAEKMELTGINYGHRDGDLDVQMHAKIPGRLLIGTETAACVTTRGVYEEDVKACHLDAYGLAPTRHEWLSWWTCQYEIPWRSLIRNPFLTGMFVWSGFDYRGEPSPCEWPCIHSHFGIMDTCGFPKDEYYYYKANFSDAPLLHLMPHWNWAGKEGKVIKVWAFSNCAEVELFLNGYSLGVRAVERDAHVEWEVPYTPGELKAVGKGGLGGGLVAVHRTTGAPHALRLLPDRSRHQGKGDAIPVRAEVLDAEGRVVPTASNFIRFSLSGPGRVIGVGNGDPGCLEPDKASSRSAFNGLALAILQADADGALKLKAEAEGLKPALIEIIHGGR